MRKTKLLRKTLGLYLVIALPVFMVSMTGFYYFLRYTITKQVDEKIFEDKMKIAEFVNNNRDDVSELYKSISCSYYLNEIPLDSTITANYKFINVYDSTEQEYEPIRELRTTIHIKDKHYELVLHESFVESDTLIYSIGSFAVMLFILLTLGISIMQWFVSKRIWNPFQATLQKISKFSPGENEFPEFEKQSIYEFNALNESLNKMISKIKKDFEKQKKFIDNVSHELQTPVSVISAQVELLIQELDLNTNTANIISVIEETINKMRKVNQALLLLSKIENEQFLSKIPVNINKLIDEYIHRNIEQVNTKKIAIEKKIEKDLVINMNATLAEILVNNLLKNALVHNIDKGKITISITANMLSITNTGKPPTMDTNLLFNKFVYSGDSLHSSGIGLSIVKEICNYYQFEIFYLFKDDLHQLSLTF
ncbi:MAG: HAMP domain-containing histidine kinase [Bacteroidales bacterium]|nr:HAMP domain-containing histidine kinase [Bacteroidales bacterium]